MLTGLAKHSHYARAMVAPGSTTGFPGSGCAPLEWEPVLFQPMPTTAEMQANTYKRGQKVRILDDIPGVPAGTRGKISLANGFTWTRYWVRFDNGMVVGHVDHEKLVRAKDYERFLMAREREAIEAEMAAEQAALEAEQSEAEAPDEVAAAAGGSGDFVVNGVTIPPYLIERSASARARLTG